MSGRDILAVLAMITPSFALIVAIALALVPAGLLTAPAAPNAQTSKARAEALVATQKPVRDPWAGATPVKYSKAANTARCNSSEDTDRACF